MLLKTFEKKTTSFLKAEIDYRNIEEHISKYQKGEVITHLRQLGIKLGLKSKNTIKARIKLFQSGKESFLVWYLKDKSKSKYYPRALKIIIHIKYLKYLEDFEKYGKEKICFQTFIDERAQKYVLDGKTYFPKRSYIHEALLDSGETSSLAHGKTRRSAKKRLRLFNENDNEVLKYIEENSVELITRKSLEIIEEIEKTPKSEQKVYAPGERIEQDGWEFSIYSQKFNLTLAVDSHGGYAVGAVFGMGETNTDHLATIAQVLYKVGIPYQMVFDKRAGIFGMGTAQIRDALERVGINVITSSDPNAKPKVERTNRTLENDFIYVFFEKYGISTVEQMNQYSEQFLDEYNIKFDKKLNRNSDESMFIPASQYDLNKLYVYYDIKVLDDQTSHFRKERYGFVTTSGVRTYVPPGNYKMKIDHEGKFSIKSCNRIFWCVTTYRNQKVALPNMMAVQQMAAKIKNEIKTLTSREIKDFINIINKKMELLEIAN